MRITSHLFGPKPNVFLWSAGFFVLLTAGVTGYAGAAAAPWLPSTALGYLALSGRLLLLSLMLGEVARASTVFLHDPGMSRPERLCLVGILVGCGTVFLMVQLATLPLNPSPDLALLAVLIMLWWLFHRFINTLFYLLDDRARRNQRAGLMSVLPFELAGPDPVKVANFQRAYQQALEQGIAFDPTDPANLRSPDR